MLQATRVGDTTVHLGVIGPPLGVPTAFIGGQPTATVGTLHSCPGVTGVVPHLTTPIVRGGTTVIIQGKPAARAPDSTTFLAPIVQGAPQC